MLWGSVAEIEAALVLGIFDDLGQGFLGLAHNAQQIGEEAITSDFSEGNVAKQLGDVGQMDLWAHGIFGKGRIWNYHGQSRTGAP